MMSREETEKKLIKFDNIIHHAAAVAAAQDDNLLELRYTQVYEELKEAYNDLKERFESGDDSIDQELYYYGIK
jgi:hypothetical protein